MDEQELQDNFVRLCGSNARADRLQHIWDNSYPHGFNDLDPNYMTRVQTFEQKAKNEGFTRTEIAAFLAL